MSLLNVRFLGTVELSLAGENLILPATRKAQSLLAYLILHRKYSQPRNRLTELFWGERPEEKARGSLSTALWHINHCLSEKGYILSDPASIQFNPQLDLWLDSEQFTDLVTRKDMAGLQSTLALYRGDFLDGFYDNWVMPERYRLEGLYLDGLARLMSIFEMKMEVNAALETALRLLTHDPLREDAHRVAMRVYCQLGQRNASLEQYQRCRESVMNELGAEPMTETTQLYQAILDGQFTSIQISPRESQRLEIVTPQRQAGHNPLDLNALPPFLGREAEMTALDRAWQRTSIPKGGLVLIHGEAGVGKTRLVEEFASHLRWKGIQVLWGRCYEFERVLPYQPVADAIRSITPILVQFKPDPDKYWIVQEMLRLVPEFAALYPDLAPQSELSTDQTRLFEAIAQFLSLISKPNGLLIVLEDLHWAADSTLELLLHLVHRLVDRPVLILGTLRPEEMGQSHPLWLLQDQLKRDGFIQEQHLGHLSPADVEALVSQMSGQGEAVLPLARRLHQETEGNPFFLMEVIKALFENRYIGIDEGVWHGDFGSISTGKFPLPASLGEAVRSRILRLDDATREAISIAAVIGHEFDFVLLKNAWGRNEEQTLQALEILLRRRLVEEGSGSVSHDYSFTHHKIQEVIYAGIPRRRRCQVHAQIGTLIENACSQRLDEYAGELAFHFSQARQLNDDLTEKAIVYLLKAGDQARGMYAQKEASGYYHQALELLKKKGDYERTARINMKLGVTYHNAFEYEQAHQAFEEGFRLWQKVSRLVQPALLPSPHPLRTNWPPITSIDPVFGMDFAGALGLQLFSGLVAYSSDLEIIPDTARKWDLLSGGCEYVFHLKNDLHWSDGRPFTTHDFEFSGKRMLAPETQSPLASLLFDVKGARAYHLGQLPGSDSVGLRAIDDDKLLVELEKPASYFLQLLANFVAVPRHCIENFREKWTEPECIVTSGPFRIERWKKGVAIRLVENPTYHGHHAGNVSCVELNLHPDPSVHLEKYALDELDVLDMRFYPMTIYEKIVRQFAGEYFSLPSASNHYIGFNVSSPPFHDERVRKAFAFAIDKELLAAVIQRGSVFPATGGFVPPGIPGHSPGIGLPYDPEQAKDLLAQAGYHQGRSFPALEALTPLNKEDPVNVYLTDQWMQVLGVEVKWKTVSPGLYLVLEKTPPNMFLSYWLADYPDPDNFLGASPILRWTGWQDESYLELLEEARFTADQAKRIKVFERADRLLVGKAVILPLSYDRQHLLIKPWVKRYPTSALVSWFWKDVVIESH